MSCDWLPHSLLHISSRHKAWRVLQRCHHEPERHSGRLIADDDVWHAGEVPRHNKDESVSRTRSIKPWVTAFVTVKTDYIVVFIAVLWTHGRVLTYTPGRWTDSSWQRPELLGKGTFHYHSRRTAITSRDHVVFSEKCHLRLIDHRMDFVLIASSRTHFEWILHNIENITDQLQTRTISI